MLTDALMMSLLLLVGGILSSQTNPLQVVFVVNTLAALFALIIFSKGRWIHIRPNKPRLHLYRVSAWRLFHIMHILGIATTHIDRSYSY